MTVWTGKNLHDMMAHKRIPRFVDPNGEVWATARVLDAVREYGVGFYQRAGLTLELSDLYSDDWTAVQIGEDVS